MSHAYFIGGPSDLMKMALLVAEPRSQHVRDVVVYVYAGTE